MEITKVTKDDEIKINKSMLGEKYGWEIRVTGGFEMIERAEKYDKELKKKFEFMGGE